jgi:hypothetical protein
MEKYFCKTLGFFLRGVEVFLCLKKRMYKKRSRRVNPSAEYHHNKFKFRQMPA